MKNWIPVITIIALWAVIVAHHQKEPTADLYIEVPCYCYRYYAKEDPRKLEYTTCDENFINEHQYYLEVFKEVTLCDSLKSSNK